MEAESSDAPGRLEPLIMFSAKGGFAHLTGS